ncbi:MAG: alpha/beta fold hydrolase [Myxococcota bacterium]
MRTEYISILSVSLMLAAGCAADRVKPAASAPAKPQHLRGRPFSTEVLTFDFEDKTLSGLLDTPRNKEAQGLVVLVPGSGRTYVHPGRANLEMRSHFTRAGFSVYAYDKPGCGQSEGKFDNEQTVENSSQELLAAVRMLRKRGTPGSHNLGMWGISRAGWIVPLALSKDPTIAFWISVSGPTHLSNMRYLLESNWRLAGKSEAQIRILSDEWLRGGIIQRSGGTYEEYVSATPTLAEDPFIKKLRGSYTKDRFLSYQRWLLNNRPTFDAKSQLMVFVPGFEAVLRSVQAPVLAIFGEGDSQVDWRATKALYERTLSPSTTIDIHTIPRCGHMMQPCEKCAFGGPQTKGVRKNGLGAACPGFYEAMTAWMTQQAKTHAKPTP